MFSDKDKKSLQLLLIFGVVAALGLFLYVRNVVKPELLALQDSTTKGQQALKEKRAELSELKRWEGREAEIQGTMTKLREKMMRLPTRIDSRQFVGILRDCILQASLSDIAVMQIKPTDMGLYQEVPYEIKCRAKYHDLGQFLMLAEQHAKQIMRVKTMDITNDMKRPSRHPVTLRLSTYVINKPVPTISATPAREVALQ